MPIQQQDNGQTGLFFLVNQNEIQIAKMEYRYHTPTIIEIHHTFVDDSLRGQGVARQLFDAAIAFVQTEQLKVIPSCSYVAKMFERLPQLQHVLAT